VASKGVAIYFPQNAQDFHTRFYVLLWRYLTIYWKHISSVERAELRIHALQWRNVMFFLRSWQPIRLSEIFFSIFGKQRSSTICRKSYQCLVTWTKLNQPTHLQLVVLICILILSFLTPLDLLNVASSARFCSYHACCAPLPSRFLYFLWRRRRMNVYNALLWLSDTARRKADLFGRKPSTVTHFAPKTYEKWPWIEFEDQSKGPVTNIVGLGAALLSSSS
jgi:hypothetical protein